MTRARAKTNWRALKVEAETALRNCEGFSPSVQIDGKLERLKVGLTHQNYRFRIKTNTPPPQADDTPYVLRKLRTRTTTGTRAEAIAHLEREAMVLQALVSQKLDFAAPRFVCFVHKAQGSITGLIETALPGVSLDCIKKEPGRRQFVLETIARIASGVHRIPLDRFQFLPHHQNGGAHIMARLDALDPDFIARDPDAAAVADWVRDHAPENRPAVLLHGDLLPQNILWDWETDRVGVVDWEFARIGDAAYDLAIVTRGNAKLFGQAGGLRRLVQAYRRAGGVALDAADVVNHELLMVLGWLEDSVCAEREHRHKGHPPAYRRNQIRAILRRGRSL